MSTHSHGSDGSYRKKRKNSGDSTGSKGSFRKGRKTLENSPLPNPIDGDTDHHPPPHHHHKERKLSDGSVGSVGSVGSHGSHKKKKHGTMEKSPLPIPIDNINEPTLHHHHNHKPNDDNKPLTPTSTSIKKHTSPSAKVVASSSKPTASSPSAKQAPIITSSGTNSDNSIRAVNVSSPISTFYSWITACFISPFKPNSFVKGQSVSVVRMCGELGLTKSDVDHLWRYFNKADVTGNGALNVAELCLQQNEVQNDYFGQLLFSVFDYDGNGEITFEEFCLCIWNAMTLDESQLPLFAFRIYDQNNSGTLSEDEMITMLKTVCGSNQQTIDHAMHYFKENDKNHDGIIDSKEFELMSKHVQLITFPAVQLLKEFRKNVLGEHVWHEKTKFRHDKFPGLYLPDIIHQLVAKPESYRGNMSCKGEPSQKIANAPIGKKTEGFVARTARRLSSALLTAVPEALYKPKTYHKDANPNARMQPRNDVGNAHYGDQTVGGQRMEVSVQRVKGGKMVNHAVEHYAK